LPRIREGDNNKESAMLKTLKTDGDTKWFVHDRFGMFIHWGLYALPARHEWVKSNEKIPDEKYDAYFRHFDPDLYDPGIWAKAASNAGMKYFVVTTKHHEGFCLWDTALTDYKASNTPAGRDLLTPMLEAFRGENIRAGLYHSLIDWHHPQFVIDSFIGPLRDSPDRKKLNRMRNQAKYAEYLHGQIRELLTQFGKIDIMWLDFSYPNRDKKGRVQGKGHESWQSEKLLKMIRDLAPDIILNDRLDLKKGWDIKTPEQYQPREWVTVNGKPVVWEACQTFSGSWGYHRDETTWKSLDQLIQMLIDTVSNGGNLLLNVGPTGRGELDCRALAQLEGIGQWMRSHSRSIYGCTQAPAWIKCPKDCRLTYNPVKKRLYVHIFAWPFQHLFLDGMEGRVEYAQLLNDASEVKMKGLAKWQTTDGDKKYNGTITLNLPVVKPDVTVPVIEIFLK
jgi:alpha-L-fucosidase